MSKFQSALSKTKLFKSGSDQDPNSIQRKNELEQESQNGHSESEIDEVEGDDISFLDNVFLQKTTYRIQGKFVEQTDDIVHKPLSFNESIKVFETGQVYRVLTRDSDGHFQTLNN